ncbi:hypothetical protein OS493_017380 [Desmophyllum pertusum]|uniref:Uncharacterized protein n=1 Tax=Desmophyllum pertusum TaxID=174260 RepID=A0A9X0A1E2_9CNID|nr:hypothetical protein OS493_017380 [Desmophyllum pertusum]
MGGDANIKRTYGEKDQCLEPDQSADGNLNADFVPLSSVSYWRNLRLHKPVVDDTGYHETVSHQGLKKYWDKINAKLDIDWTETTWKDLEKPLYSGLAARLFLARIRASIPTDLPSQAQYWKTHYNTKAGKGTAPKFIHDVQHATGCAR